MLCEPGHPQDEGVVRHVGDMEHSVLGVVLQAKEKRGLAVDQATRTAVSYFQIKRSGHRIGGNRIHFHYFSSYEVVRRA